MDWKDNITVKVGWSEPKILPNDYWGQINYEYYNDITFSNNQYSAQRDVKLSAVSKTVRCYCYFY